MPPAPPVDFIEEFKPVIHAPLETNDEWKRVIEYNIERANVYAQQTFVVNPFATTSDINPTMLTISTSTRRQGLFLSSLEQSKGYEYDYVTRLDYEMNVKTPFEIAGTLEHFWNPNFLQCFNLELRLIATDLGKPKNGQGLIKTASKVKYYHDRFPYSGALKDLWPEDARVAWTSQPQEMTNRKMGRFRFVVKGEDIPELSRDRCDTAVWCMQLVAVFVPERAEKVKQAMDSYNVAYDHPILSTISVPNTARGRSLSEDVLPLNDYTTSREVSLMEFGPVIFMHQKNVRGNRKK